jgi:hypothetical protein
MEVQTEKKQKENSRLSNENESKITRPKRDKRPPVWSRDYVGVTAVTK